MMARIISIIMQNLVEIARRTSAWDDEVWYFHFFYSFVTVSPDDGFGT